MKKIIASYCLLLICSFASAQKQANIWYFGNKAGLDFNQVPPRPVVSNMGANEGCSVISDNNGKVLFYTNGRTVVNRKNVTMKNGDGLMGDLSSSNNTLILPLPGNDSIYYLFTVGAQNQASKGFRYNVINMKGDGGYGEVVQKNVQIEDEVYEKLAAVGHCNKTDTWITIRKWGVNEYHTYLFSASGLNPAPVVSPASFTPSNPIGIMKYAPGGKKMVAVYSFETNVIELMDFDNTTGVLSNSLNFQPYVTVPSDEILARAYGAEFSSNANLLYISSNTSATEPCMVFQFDVTSNNVNTILASKQVIANTSPWSAGALQMGPDQKIYLSMWKDTSISVIENPDVYGPGCNFVYNKIFLGINNNTAPLQVGLPNFSQSYFDPASNHYDFSRTSGCTNLDVSFKINRTNGIDSVKWDFGDGQNAQSLAPIHHYNAPGFYDVTLVVYKVDCSGMNDIITRKIWIASSENLLGKDTSGCNSFSIDIGVNDIPEASYYWNTGATINKISTNTQGLYWLEVFQNGCTIRDSVIITFVPIPTVDAGKDTSICLGQQVVLFAGNNLADSYLWSTGQTTAFITATNIGEYKVTVTKDGCSASDSVKVNWGDCGIFIPSAFTPNNDGLNETFGVIGSTAVNNFSFQIYNKWGQRVFYGTDISQRWDGTFKGKKVPLGAYPWTLYYVTGSGIRKFLQGIVMVIR